MNKNIININNKNQYHGYQEWYTFNTISHRGNWKHNTVYNYQEHHRVKQTTYHIK